MKPDLQEISHLFEISIFLHEIAHANIIKSYFMHDFEHEYKVIVSARNWAILMLMKNWNLCTIWPTIYKYENKEKS